MKSELNREKMSKANKRAERRLSSFFLRSHRALEARADNAASANDEERERVQREKEQLQRAFGRLASALGERDRQRLQLQAKAIHDLKSPLMVVGGAARQLRHKNISVDEREEWLDLIIRNVTNLEFLVADLVTETRQEAQSPKRWDCVDLSELARTLVREYDAPSNTHALHFSGCEDRDCMVMGEREALGRLLVNLLSNAVHSSAVGRDVCVSVRRRGNHVLLEVEDDGHGEPISSTERMFLPFTSLDGDQPIEEEESLELALVKCIAQIHGAQISVQGTPGCGTTFQVCFPAQSHSKKST